MQTTDFGVTSNSEETPDYRPGMTPKTPDYSLRSDSRLQPPEWLYTTASGVTPDYKLRRDYRLREDSRQQTPE